MNIEDQGATPEVDQIPQDEAPKSMDDTIRDTLRSLNAPDDSATSAPEGMPAGAVEDAETKAARLRDPAGKYAAAPVVGESAPVVGEAPQTEIKPAPNTWKKEAADAWTKADPVIRAEVERREQDFFKGIEQYKTAAGFGQSIERTIAPYVQTLQQLGVSPDRAIGELMAADHKLRFGTPDQKQTYFAQLAHEYGIDIGQAAQAQQSIDPNVYALQNQNQALQSQLNNYHQSAQQQAEQSLNSEINAFSADPAHSHFEAVRGHMSALLQAGQAKDLADAYEQAIYANPTTRAAVLQQQATAQREEAAKKAQAAKAAASVNTRARPSMPVAVAVGSMEDTIRANFRRLTGAT